MKIKNRIRDFMLVKNCFTIPGDNDNHPHIIY